MRKLSDVSVAVSALLAGWVMLGAAQSSAPASPLFVEAAAQSGLAFTHVSGASGQYYIAEQMGAGVALFDYDGDGDLDVYLVQGGPFEPGGKIGPAHPTEPVVSQRPQGRRRRRPDAAIHGCDPSRPASVCAATAWVPWSATTTTMAISISS